MKKRVNAKTLEAILFLLMTVFAVAAVFIFVKVFSIDNPDPLVIVIELLIVLIICLLGLTQVLIKIWEQHIIPYYVHESTHKEFEKKVSKKTKRKK